jgi:hypothetical protein
MDSCKEDSLCVYGLLMECQLRRFAFYTSDQLKLPALTVPYYDNTTCVYASLTANPALLVCKKRKYSYELYLKNPFLTFALSNI